MFSGPAIARHWKKFSLTFSDKYHKIKNAKRAWLSGRASASQAEDRGFESRRPLHQFIIINAGVAQPAEQRYRKPQVVRSTRIASSS